MAAMARLIQIQIHVLFDSPLMDFENAGEGKSEGADGNRIGIRNEGTKEHRQIDIQLRN